MKKLKVIVLDDDPTGTQTVRDVAVLTVWDMDTLVREMQSAGDLFFMLFTNIVILDLSSLA